MSLAIRAHFDPIRSLDYSLISATHHSVGVEFTHHARNVWLYNGTDRTLLYSFDGANDHVILPALGYWFWDITSNKTVSQGLFLPEGTQLYAKTTTTNPTMGKTYCSVMYGIEL